MYLLVDEVSSSIGDGQSDVSWSSTESIFSFVLRHTDANSGKLLDSTPPLPDEEVPEDGNVIRFAPGALDGVVGHHAALGDVESDVKSDVEGGDEDIASRVANLFVKVAHEGGKADENNLYSLLNDKSTLDFIDSALALIVENEAPIEPYLHPFVRKLVLESRDRGPVKFGISLLGLIRNPDDVRTVSSIGVHEEFTLFSAFALTNMAADPETELWDLAKKVDGWGRIQIVERLFPTENEALKRWLLTEGYRNDVMYEYLTYIAATQGDLAKALADSDVSNDLLFSAAEILDGLMGEGPAEDLYDYDQSALAISRYLNQLERARPTHLLHLIIVNKVLDFLQDDWRSSEDKLQHGWTTEVIAETREKSKEISSWSTWAALISQGLEATNAHQFWLANEAAQLLGIDTFDAHAHQVANDPEDPVGWYQLIAVADSDRIEQVVRLAEALIDLEAIATGANDEPDYGLEHTHYGSLAFVVQELARFPHTGWNLISASLNSPNLRNRYMAIRALAAWGSFPDEIYASLREFALNEPDADVQDRLERLLRGEPQPN